MHRAIFVKRQTDAVCIFLSLGLDCCCQWSIADRAISRGRIACRPENLKRRFTWTLPNRRVPYFVVRCDWSATFETYPNTVQNARFRLAPRIIRPGIDTDQHESGNWICICDLELLPEIANCVKSIHKSSLAWPIIQWIVDRQFGVCITAGNYKQ